MMQHDTGISTAVYGKMSEAPLRIRPFLEQNKVGKDETFSHTQLSGGSYYIKDDDLDYFMKLYAEAVFDKKIPFTMSERITDRVNTPWRTDIDLRWRSTSRERIYKMEDILAICRNTVAVMEDIFEPLEKSERLFFIMEKPTPSVDFEKTGDDENKYMKDGVHIMAPYIVGNASTFLEIRDQLMKLCEPDLKKYPFTNSIKDIFDRTILTTNNWLMYGSSKKNQPPYLITGAYFVYRDHVEPASVPSPKELVMLLSVRNKPNATIIRTEKEEYFRQLYAEFSAPKKRNVGKISYEDTGAVGGIIPRRKRQIDQNLVEIARKCIGLFTVERAKERNSWRAVGLAAHNISDDLFDDWVRFSRLPEEYKDEPISTYQKEWMEMTKSRTVNALGIGSLKMWARQDKPEEYKNIKKDDVFQRITDAAKNKQIPEYDIAIIIKKMYEKEYVYTKDKMWYFFDDDKHRWVEDPTGINLRHKLSDEVYHELRKAQQYYASLQDAADNNDNNKKLAEGIQVMMRNVKQTNVKDRIMKECSELFYDDNDEFRNRLDTCKTLICFNNGVYDLVNKDFREGRPEDYISQTTNIDYIPYDPKTPEMIDLTNFLKQIIPISAVRERTLVVISTFLNGSTQNETFEIWSGSGGNGKSKLTELIEKALGQYACKLPVSLLTSKRSASNAASPELVVTKGKRFATIAEPGEGARINAGLMKELTGGDTIMARALFRMPVEFKPQFKIVLMCNDKPLLPAHDEGTWRRIKLTEFYAKFVDEPCPHNPFHQLKDTNLNAKLELWAPYMMSLMIHYSNMHWGKKLPRVKEVEKYIREYRNKNEPFSEFFTECLTISPDNTKQTNLNEIYRVYENWFRDANGNMGKPRTKRDLQEYLSRKLGTSDPQNEQGIKTYQNIQIIKKTFGEPADYAYVSDDISVKSNDPLG